MTQNYEPLGNTELSHTRPASMQRFMFGTTYYPEHWDAEAPCTGTLYLEANDVAIIRQ